MATRDGKRPPAPPPPPSQPAAAAPEDVNWDDDTVPRLDFDDPAFERVTAIPELPSEFLAKQMMAVAPSDEPPPPTVVAPGGLRDNESDPFELRAAITSSDLVERGGDSDVPQSQLSTAPPTRGAPEELVLEIDDSALTREPVPRDRQRALSLELDLDLSGLDPAQSVPPSSDPQLREIADRYATGDFSGALVIAEGILEGAPGHAEALRYANKCRDVLTQMYSARLGPLDQRVTVAVPSDQIRWLSLDHRSGFLLSLVDGTSSVEELLDISGMAKLDALRILYTLREERVIALVARGT